MNEDKAILLEQLRWETAKYSHAAWSNWMKYLFTQGKLNKSGTFTINKACVERWQRQMNTSFDDLPDKERSSDFNEADTILQVQRNLLGGS